MSQEPLFDRYAPRLFGGDYEPEDEATFKRDLDRVLRFFQKNAGVWFTKLEIARGAGLSEGKDATPRVRDLRKEAHGKHTIERRKIDGKYRYRFLC